MASILANGAAEFPDRPLLEFETGDGAVDRWTWREGLERSLRTASLLRDHGVGAGDRVHLHLPNRPEFLLAWFAAARLGASIVPTNPLASRDELAYVSRHSGARLSIADASGADVVRAARGDDRVIDCDDVALDDASIDDLPHRVEPQGELGVLYTSGTTSRPKGVKVTHANYVYAGEVVARAIRLGPQDRFMAALPLFHANAQYYVTMATLVMGATMILLPRFSATTWLDSATRHRATVASLFAAPIRMILAKAHDSARVDHQLRLVLFAQNLTDHELDRWDEVVDAPLVQLYGMTETIGPPVMNPLEGGRADAIGRPTLGYSVRIVDERQEPVLPGSPGELQVAGEPGLSLMAGYLDDPDATSSTIVDGWLRTGDLVREDSDGLIVFVDRAKDMIKRAGENVAAGEVESVLVAHPGVRDAAVVGVPDTVRDEQILAFVVLEASNGVTTEELTSWCSDRMARFRVPSVFRIVDDLPRTSVGKVRKQELRDLWQVQASSEG